MKNAYGRLTIATLVAAVFLSCASIPSLNEAPEYSSYLDERKAEAGAEGVLVFVLYRARGSASDDLHEFLVERRGDPSGSPSFSIVLRYTGMVPENISGLSASVDGRDLELGAIGFERGYSGRYISERLSVPVPGDAISAIREGVKLTLRYSCDYPAPPHELPGPGFEALKIFLGD